MGRLTKRITTKFPSRTLEGIELNSEWGLMNVYCEEEFYDIYERLAHYEDLEEAGRLIELPCAVGDTVWVVDLGVDKKITKQIDGETWHRVVRERNITERCFVISDYGQLGRYVFLTKEEAEAKLKELEGDHIADVRKMGKE